MRLLLAALVAMVLLSAVLADKNQARYRHKSNKKWEAFKKSHLRNHHRNLIRNDDEEEQRFVAFEAQDNLIEENNAKFAAGESTFEMEHNALSVLSEEEMKAYAGVLPESENPDRSRRAATIETWVPKSKAADLPKKFDWREVGWTQPIRNQGGCGSCWTFSSAAAMEAQIWMATGEMVDLSEQYLNDCDSASNNCQGGWPQGAVKMSMDRGIPKEEVSPYQGTFQGCRFQTLTAAQKTHPISNLYMVTPSYQAGVAKAEQDTMDMLVNNGPVMTVIFTNDKFKNYKTGIFKNEPSEVGRAGNHAVTIIGYGEDASGKYWIIRNSWDDWWGDAGTMKFDRSGINHGSLYDQNYSPFAATKSGRTRIGPKNPGPVISTTRKTTTTTDPCTTSGSTCAEWADNCVVYDSANGRCADNRPYCKSCKGGSATKGGQVTAAPARRDYDGCVVGSHCSSWAANAACLAYSGSQCTKWSGCLACAWD